MPVTEYVWDDVNDCVLEETDENGNTLVTYTHEPGPNGSLISEHRDGTTYTHHYDALGSTTMLTDDTGAVTDTFTYDAWGNQVARTGTTPTPYTWCGRWGYQDDTATIGAYYVRERPYEPTIARWTSADLTDTTALYRYVDNSPVLLTDPSGLQPTTITLQLPFPLTVPKDAYAVVVNVHVLHCPLDQGCALPACDKPEDYCGFFFVVVVARSYVLVKMAHEPHGTCKSDIDRSNGPSFIEVGRKEKPSVCRIQQSDFDPNSGQFTMPAGCKDWLDAPTRNNSEFKFKGTIKYVKYDFGLDMNGTAACPLHGPRRAALRFTRGRACPGEAR